MVSALKYRPQKFSQVIGQDIIINSLQNSIINNKLAQSYLFCGTRGVGKTSIARIFARMLNCEIGNGCGVCSVCMNNNLNLFEIDGASNNSIDETREIINQIRFKPQFGKYKIYIIDEVHMLTYSAFNSLLKTLEEPPEYVIFILCTTEKNKIPLTILSRCQIFQFKRVSIDNIILNLKNICLREDVIMNEKTLYQIAEKADGSIRDSLSIFDNAVNFNIDIIDIDTYFLITEYIINDRVGDMLGIIYELFNNGFEGDIIINGLLKHFRNILLKDTKLLDVGEFFKVKYKKYNLKPSFILSVLNVLNDGEITYKNSYNKSAHVELCLLRVCYLNQNMNIKFELF